MSDIVERLHWCPEYGGWSDAVVLMPEAADEIERLRVALRGLLDEVMCFVVNPPSAALNHAIEEAGCALEPKP